MQKRRTFTALITLSLSASLLAGCASGYNASVDQAAQLQPTPALTRQQAATVVADLGKKLEAADQKKDPKLLDPIMKDPAKRIRAAQYKVAQDEKFASLSFKSDSFTPVNALTWPRHLVVATSPDGQKAASMMLLTQDGARANYKLESYARIFPGEKIELPRAEVGATQLAKDAKGFLVTPEEAIKRYTQTVGVNSDAAKLQVAPDTLMEAVNAETAALQTAVGDKGTVAWKVLPGLFSGAISGPNGDAIVFGTLKMVTVIEKKDENSSIRLNGPMARILGVEANIRKRVELTREAMFVLVVPGKDAKTPIKAIAASMVPVGAKPVE